MEMDFASKAKGNAALTTGIIGTVGTAISTGILGNLFGVGGVSHENCPVNRYELSLERTITDKNAEIAFLKARDASKTDDLALYQYVDGRLRGIEAQIAQQAVVNAQTAASLSCLTNSVNALSGLTKIVVPISNICPQPATATTTATT